MKYIKSILIAWLILELMVFYGVAKLTGIFYALLLLLLLMALGMFLFRRAGLSRFKTMQEQLQRGQPLDSQNMPSVSRLISGLLLVIPGFITSIIGLLLLIPQINRWLVNLIFKKALLRASPHQGTGPRASGRIIDLDTATNDELKDKGKE